MPDCAASRKFRSPHVLEKNQWGGGGIFHFCDLCRRCTGTDIIAESGGFKKALKGVSVEAPKPHLGGPFPGDSVRILGVCPAVTLTFGL